MAPLFCSAWTDCNVVHKPSRNKESPSLLLTDSLPISAFIRGRFGLKRPGKIHRARCALASCGLSLSTRKECWEFGCGYPSACGHQGAAHEVVGKAATTRVGCYFRSCRTVWRIPPPPCFRPYTHPSRDCHPGAPLGPGCKAKCGLGNPPADGLGYVPDKSLATPRPN